jgi:hypothetical protein
MKTTNKEHIIKEKLQGVDLPDMDASWGKMEQSMKAAMPVQSGWSYFLAKYKIYLNLFITIVTIGVIALYVKSKITGQQTAATDVFATTQNYDVSYLSFETTVDHNNDLPLPTGPNTQHIATTTNLDYVVSQMPVLEKIIVPEITLRKGVTLYPAIIDTLPDPDYTDAYLMTMHDEIPKLKFIKNQVGVKMQIGVLPDVSASNILQNTGFSLFARRYINARTAIHLELGYNPIAIRPMTYVERYNVFNNFNYTQTDSAQVKTLNYVTIPLNIYYQLTPEFSCNFGPQVSFLTSMSGELTKKFNYPTAPETASVTEKAKIENRGGFNKQDVGLNLELNWHRERLELGFRFQQSLGDYSADQLSTQKHPFSKLQIKAGWLIND